MANNETIADIIARKRRLAAEMEKTLGDQHSSVEMLKDDADRLEAAYKRELDGLKKQVADLQRQLPKPDPNWRDICAKCFENGATEPPDCKYYTEDGCMSPIPDQHPLIQVGDCAKLREVLLQVIRSMELESGHMCTEKKRLGMHGQTQEDLCKGCRARNAECWTMTLKRECEAALAAPPRNCDALTADERTHKFIEKWEKAHGESIDGKTIIYLSSFSRWLQLPCEGEEAK